MIRTFFAALFTILLVAPAWAGTEAIKISGSTSVANVIVVPHQAEIERAAGIKIIVDPVPSGEGLEALFSGDAQIVMISSNLYEILKRMNDWADIYKVDKGNLYTFSLGVAEVEFIVSADNPIMALTKEQIEAIYLGTITNWKDVGGADAPIIVVSEPKTGAMRTMFEHDLLDGRPIFAHAVIGFDGPNVAKYVKSTPESIGFISSTTPKEDRINTKVLKTDILIEQHLALVTRGEPEGKIKQVVDAILHFHL